jgi:hypothetical protein
MKTVKMMLAPLAIVMALAFASNASAQVITPFERAVIRHDVRDLRYDIRRAGPFYNPAERAVIRHDVRNLRWDVRRSVWR